MDGFTISTSCRSCGIVHIDPTRLRIHLSDDSVSHFSCACPLCSQTLGGTVGTEVARTLVGRGVPVTEVPFSVEVVERPTGPSFTPDDVLAFHETLERDGWFEALKASIDA